MDLVNVLKLKPVLADSKRSKIKRRKFANSRSNEEPRSTWFYMHGAKGWLSPTERFVDLQRVCTFYSLTFTFPSMICSFCVRLLPSFSCVVLVVLNASCYLMMHAPQNIDRILIASYHIKDYMMF